MANSLRVRYMGTNVGKIYLSDIEKRLSLGGSQEGDYLGGQDRYIIWGETKVLDLSTDVLASWNRGVLKYFSTAASSTSFIQGAPLTLDEGVYTSANDVPRTDLGDTGGTRYEDAYMTVLANSQWAPTGVAGATGYYYGNV